MEVLIIPIMPKGKPLDLQLPILRALKEEAVLAKRGLLLPTQSWDEGVKFKDVLKIRRVGLVREVTTTNRIYGYNDVGTPRHVIRARNAPKLHFFRAGFVSKTKPGRLVSGPGRRADADEDRVDSVNHPGTKARGFSKIVAKNGDQRFKLRVRAEIRHEISKWSR